MSADKQLAEKISHWLEGEAPRQVPDRVLRATFERTRSTRQQRGWRAPLGGMHVNRLVPIGLAAAAVIAVLVAGSQLLRQPAPGGVGGTTSTVAPTEAPSASVPATPSVIPAVEGLPAGPFALTDGRSVDGMPTLPTTVTITAPGWNGDPGSAVLTKGGAEAPAGAGLIVFFGDSYPYGDPCRWLSTRPETPATTTDEVVAALGAQASRDASEPIAVTLDGHDGKGITLHVPDDAVFSECDGAKFGSWGLPGPDQTPMRYQQDPGQIDEVWVVDVDGETAIVDWTYYEGTPQAVVDELRAIVESIRFEQP
jgi:hypothetical protein